LKRIKNKTSKRDEIISFYFIFEILYFWFLIHKVKITKEKKKEKQKEINTVIVIKEKSKAKSSLQLTSIKSYIQIVFLF